jgi:hypothetical protein
MYVILVVTRPKMSARTRSAKTNETPRSSSVVQRHGNALVSRVTTVDVRGYHKSHTRRAAGVSERKMLGVFGAEEA